MVQVLVVFLADVFVDGLTAPVYVPRRCPRSTIGTRIIDRGFVVKRVLVRASPAFGDVHLIRVWVSEIIQPRTFVEVGHIHHEGVALPAAHGVTEPGCALKLVLGRVRAAIHEDLAPDVCAAFEDLIDALEFGLLENDHRIRSGVQTGTAGRQAISLRIVLGLVLGMVVVDGCRPRQERYPGFGGCATTTTTATASTSATTATGVGIRCCCGCLSSTCGCARWCCCRSCATPAGLCTTCW